MRYVLAEVTFSLKDLATIIGGAVGLIGAVLTVRARSIKSLRGEIDDLRKDLEWERKERDRDQQLCSGELEKLKKEMATLRGENSVLIGGIGERIGLAVVDAVVSVNEKIAHTAQAIANRPGDTSGSTSS